MRFIVLAQVAVSLAFAAETTPPTQTQTAAPAPQVTTSVPAPTSGSLMGSFDFRPTYRSTNGSAVTENFAQAGYRFASGNSVYFRQEFNTNVYDPNGKTSDATLMDGSLRAKINNILQDRQSGWSLSIEPRIYVPTNEIKRDGGMITAFRNYFKVRKQFTPTSYLQISDSPVVHVYNQPGYLLGSRAFANPDVENRFLIEAEMELFVKGLALYVPIEIASAHYRNFQANALLNATWGHKGTFWPEIAYMATPQIRVGIAFRTDNLIKPDFSGLTLSDAFQKGVTQVTLNASL